MSGIFSYFTDGANWTGSGGIPVRLIEHLAYSIGALILAAAIGIPLGLYIGHTGRGKFVVATVANALRALPSLGLLLLIAMLLQPRLGGDLSIVIPSIIVLIVLAVPPILTSTYAGVQGVDPAARDAAYGMGMTGREVLFQVELPCALALILSGARSATLQIVSTATIAAYVSLGGFGRYVIDGQANQNYPEMVAGGVLVGLLAIGLEALLAGVQRIVVPRGLSGRYAKAERREAEAAPETEKLAPAR